MAERRAVPAAQSPPPGDFLGRIEIGPGSARARLSVAVATCFYLSYIPAKFSELLARGGAARKWTGAGFLGTAFGWAAFYGLPSDPAAYAAVVASSGLAACWISSEAERALGVHDDPRIIIDEVIGYWVAAAFLPRGASSLAAAFVLFRFFDSVKLPPYRWLERLPGGYGVVLDDVGAGIVANAAVQLLRKAAVLP